VNPCANSDFIGKQVLMQTLRGKRLRLGIALAQDVERGVAQGG